MGGRVSGSTASHHVLLGAATVTSCANIHSQLKMAAGVLICNTNRAKVFLKLAIWFELVQPGGFTLSPICSHLFTSIFALALFCSNSKNAGSRFANMQLLAMIHCNSCGPTLHIHARVRRTTRHHPRRLTRGRRIWREGGIPESKQGG